MDMLVEKQETLSLRPHHIFCDRFLPLDDLLRGGEFDRVSHKIKELIESESDLIIVVKEGPDQLCHSCPDYKNDRCENSKGDEDAVRKWDSKILKGFSVSYGQKLTVREVLSLIKEKAPLEFCKTRCSWKPLCVVFGN